MSWALVSGFRLSSVGVRKPLTKWLSHKLRTGAGGPRRLARGVSLSGTGQVCRFSLPACSTHLEKSVGRAGQQLACAGMEVLHRQLLELQEENKVPLPRCAHPGEFHGLTLPPPDQALQGKLAANDQQVQDVKSERLAMVKVLTRPRPCQRHSPLPPQPHAEQLPVDLRAIRARKMRFSCVLCAAGAGAAPAGAHRCDRRSQRAARARLRQAQRPREAAHRHSSARHLGVPAY